MGRVGMPQRMDGDAHFRDLGPLFGFAEGALDTGATHRGSRRRTLGVIPPGGGKEPGGVPMGFPGGAEQDQRLFGEGDVPVFGALAAVDMDLETLAIAVGDLQGEGCMEPESSTRDSREGDLVVEGGGSLEGASNLFNTEDGREPMFGWRMHERQGGPVVLEVG